MRLKGGGCQGFKESRCCGQRVLGSFTGERKHYLRHCNSHQGQAGALRTKGWKGHHRTSWTQISTWGGSEDSWGGGKEIHVLDPTAAHHAGFCRSAGGYNFCTNITKRSSGELGVGTRKSSRGVAKAAKPMSKCQWPQDGANIPSAGTGLSF